MRDHTYGDIVLQLLLLLFPLLLLLLLLLPSSSGDGWNGENSHQWRARFPDIPTQIWEELFDGCHGPQFWWPLINRSSLRAVWEQFESSSIRDDLFDLLNDDLDLLTDFNLKRQCQAQSDFRAVSEQFQSSFRAVVQSRTKILDLLDNFYF